MDLSVAFEAQGAELEAVKGKLAELEKTASAAAAEAELEKGAFRQQVNVLTDQTHTAMARVQEIEKRAEDLKAALSGAQGSVQRLTAELEAERGQHGVTRGALTAVSTELVTVKAWAEAQAGVQVDQVERLKRLEAAKLAGQAAALSAQQAELIRVIEGRDGARSGPKGKK